MCTHHRIWLVKCGNPNVFWHLKQCKLLATSTCFHTNLRPCVASGDCSCKDARKSFGFGFNRKLQLGCESPGLTWGPRRQGGAIIILSSQLTKAMHEDHHRCSLDHCSSHLVLFIPTMEPFLEWQETGWTKSGTTANLHNASMFIKPPLKAQAKRIISMIPILKSTAFSSELFLTEKLAHTCSAKREITSIHKTHTHTHAHTQKRIYKIIYTYVCLLYSFWFWFLPCMSATRCRSAVWSIQSTIHGLVTELFNLLSTGSATWLHTQKGVVHAPHHHHFLKYSLFARSRG